MQAKGKTAPLRWGIAGAGAIARRFCRDVNQHGALGQVVAIAARDQRRAQIFADEQGLPLAFGSYQALAQSLEVDAVYVAVIHPQHAALIKEMLLAGKHVLVEKPAVTRQEDWDALVALAHERGLLLLEAMKVMCFPAMRTLLARLPELPGPLSLRAAFGSVQPREGKLFDPALEGGAAWDVGVYPLWLYAAFCRQLGLEAGEPEVLLQRSPGEVDLSADFAFDGAIRAELGASIIEDLDKAAYLSGEWGGEPWTLIIEGKWWNPQGVRWLSGAPDATWAQEICEPVAGGGMQHEADHFAHCVAEGLLDSAWLPQALTRQVLGWVEGGLSSAPDEKA
ncbi:Gfo/Idh/MocA family protein [Aeromonas tecta]|uniref:Gfo/Idh/MocA family protein n=1 Tax=Aeromonas tecta TaxID=324617 RepID=UPI000681B53A|nr:Gfo/Idh/MocA family oxidoreductase [Aeromonas tecta]